MASSPSSISSSRKRKTSSSVSSPPPSNDQRKKSSFQRRQLTVMKKAEELSTLCGTQVAVICYGPDGELQTWPRDLSKVRELAVNYMKQNDTKKRKKSLNLSELRGKAEKGCLPKTKTEKGFELNTQKLHALSAEKLSELGDALGREMKTLQERLRFLGTQKQKKPAEENQSRNLCRDQENQEPAIHICPDQEYQEPLIISDVQDMVLPPQLSTFALSDESFNSVGCSVPFSYINNCDQSINICPDQEHQEPVITSYFPDMVLPSDLQGSPLFSAFMSSDENLASFNYVGSPYAPCSYNNYALDFVPPTSFGSHRANNNWLYNSEFNL
ncbi:PREDICTED: agamous-like MADS-box protein AGL53 [Tarenaya hassleriana]|uniref:agamous-like MADS-box protein AGL53 n=1 Tax=Tarenaya hassleriana TaxID=28532 RepID=UPI0008FD710E|nr:PREDICTED: agamous-like MADS-box protein AGL53 [Tarenaya hassleriana]